MGVTFDDDARDIRDPESWRWDPSLRARTSADTDGKVAELLGHLETTGQDQLILRLVANSPNGFRPFVLMADGLVNRPTLPADVREAVVLHLAVELRDGYEWHSHIEPARAAGLSSEQVDDLRSGAVAGPESRLSDDQCLAIDLVDRLRDGLGWSEDDWRAATAAWQVEGAFDLLLSAGWWAGLVPLVLRGMGVQFREAPSEAS